MTGSTDNPMLGDVRASAPLFPVSSEKAAVVPMVTVHPEEPQGGLWEGPMPEQTKAVSIPEDVTAAGGDVRDYERPEAPAPKIPRTKSGKLDKRYKRAPKKASSRPSRAKAAQPVSADVKPTSGLDSVIAGGAYTPYDSPTFTIHFITDGFTAFEKVWCRGEELSIEAGSAKWLDTIDGNNRSWMAYSPQEQVKAYGRQLYAEGPWQGLDYEHSLPEDADSADRDALARADLARRQGMPTAR